MSYSTSRGTIVGTLKNIEDGQRYWRLTIAETHFNRDEKRDEYSAPVHVYVPKDGRNAEAMSKSMAFLTSKLENEPPVAFDYALRSVGGTTMAVAVTKPDMCFVGIRKTAPAQQPQDGGYGAPAPADGGYDDSAPF